MTIYGLNMDGLGIDTRGAKVRRALFGASTVRYPGYYTPKPYSKSFVQHLDHWYAQSHPDEDFAETFAVWLTPNSHWRERYEGWPAIYVRLELGLLQELGFGLDLEKCAATGETEDLAFVSPRTGRAVSRAAAEPYKGKLLPLPAFLSTGGLPADPEELRQGLDLTGFFLERHVFWPHNKPLPPARARFMESVQR